MAQEVNERKYLISESTLNLLFENLDKGKPNTIKVLQDKVLAEINESQQKPKAQKSSVAQKRAVAPKKSPEPTDVQADRPARSN